jgi:hypothetical protein
MPCASETRKHLPTCDLSETALEPVAQNSGAPMLRYHDADPGMRDGGSGEEHI